MTSKEKQILNKVYDYTRIFKAFNPADIYANVCHQEASHYAHEYLGDLIRKIIDGRNVDDELEMLEYNFKEYLLKVHKHSTGK